MAQPACVVCDGRSHGIGSWWSHGMAWPWVSEAEVTTHMIKSLRWLAPTAVAVGAFGVAACGGGDAPDAVEVNADNRAAQLAAADRYVGQQKDRGSHSCKWIAVGAPPTPDAVAAVENCDGQWTGNVEWVPSRSAGVKAPAR
jgi:hypothetical protein